MANVDALEDATAAFHWCWELRTFTGLPKAVKQHADAARKHRKQVSPTVLETATAIVPPMGSPVHSQAAAGPIAGCM